MDLLEKTMPETFAALKRGGGTFEIDGIKEWYEPVERLSQQLAKLHANFGIVQIKEKYGSLRYYLAPIETDRKTLNKMLDLISQAEHELTIDF